MILDITIHLFSYLFINYCFWTCTIEIPPPPPPHDNTMFLKIVHGNTMFLKIVHANTMFLHKSITMFSDTYNWNTLLLIYLPW